jgi:hypothetical protein
MVNLNDFKEQITNLNVKGEVSTGTIANKYYEIPASRVIVNQFAPNRQLSLSREDIIKETDLRTKYVKILVWGYRRDLRNTSTLLDKLDIIIDYQKKYEKDRDGNKYLKNLLSIKRMGLSTASKILYFMGVKIDNYPAVIIDNRVITALPLVEQFTSFYKKRNSASFYRDIIEAIGKAAKDLDTDSDKIEYFLYKLGIAWEKHMSSLRKENEQRADRELLSRLMNQV